MTAVGLIATLEAAFEAQRAMLWGLAYRMTGSAAEADDIVQETFLRALERPPADTRRDIAPWLTRVAMNLARDRLRKRQRSRETYAGPWLPEPAPEAGAEEISGASRLVLRESASFATLLALEVLTPLQRAVLVLRDVLELTTKDAAIALETSEGNVRTTLHRARAAVAEARRPGRTWDEPLEQRLARHRDALAQLMGRLLQGDVAGLQACLAADVTMTTDAAGEFSSNTRPVVGTERVIKLLHGLLRKNGPPTGMDEVVLNGELAWLLYYPPKPGRPRRVVHQVMLMEFDADGRIQDIYAVMASAKIARLLGSQ